MVVGIKRITHIGYSTAMIRQKDGGLPMIAPKNGLMIEIERDYIPPQL